MVDCWSVDCLDSWTLNRSVSVVSCIDDLKSLQFVGVESFLDAVIHLVKVVQLREVCACIQMCMYECEYVILLQNVGESFFFTVVILVFVLFFYCCCQF